MPKYIAVILNDNGQIVVETDSDETMDNKILCYGLLEIARQTVQKPPSQIKAPNSADIGKLIKVTP